MSRLNAAIKNDLKLITLMRDEIALHSHLLQGELKQRWNELEIKREDLQEHIARAEVAGGDALKEFEAAADLVVQSIRSGYAGVRSALKH